VPGRRVSLRRLCIKDGDGYLFHAQFLPERMKEAGLKQIYI
jgi:hypothetical protein